AYPRRAELLRALLMREERRILAALLADAPAPPSAPAETSRAYAGRLFLAWVEHGLATVRERPDEFRLLLAPTAETPDEVREHVESGRAVVLERLRALLDPLKPADPELTARAVLAIAERMALDVLDGVYGPERVLAFTRSMLDALHVA